MTGFVVEAIAQVIAAPVAYERNFTEFRELPPSISVHFRFTLKTSEVPVQRAGIFLQYLYSATPLRGTGARCALHTNVIPGTRSAGRGPRPIHENRCLRIRLGPLPAREGRAPGMTEM